MIYCSVCGSKVDAKKNVVSEHRWNGQICYGSFMPLQNPEFAFEREERKLGKYFSDRTVEIQAWPPLHR